MKRRDGPPFRLVVVAASLGGVPAIATLLRDLPSGFPVPVLLIQHRPPEADDARLVEVLQRKSSLPMRVASAGRAVTAGVSLIPAAVTASLEPTLQFHMAAPTPERRWLGGDSLFTSAATQLGSAVIGVVLTGRQHDGTNGVRAIKQAGGRVLAEDPTTAFAEGMPTSAIATGCVDHVLPIERMAAALTALVMAPGGAELFRVPIPSWARLSAVEPRAAIG